MFHTDLSSAEFFDHTGVEFAEVNVPTVDNRTGLARGFVEPIRGHGIAGHGVTPERDCSLKVVGRPLSATFPATLPTCGRYAKSCVWLGLREVHPSGLEPETSGSVDRCSIQLS